MTYFNVYERKVTTGTMRPYIEGEDLSDVGISDYEKSTIRVGDMIACNPDHPTEQWIVSKEDFENTYEPIPIERVLIV